MGITAMRERILEVIRSDKDAEPGRAGETPLSSLATDFGKLKGIDALIAAEACKWIIESPPDDLTEHASTDFWLSISFLTQYLPPKGRKELIEPYRARLLGHDHLEGKSRVHAFMGYITSGGVLTEVELMNDLREIRSSLPILWIDAAVYSRRFTFAKQQLKLLFREQAISWIAALTLYVVLHSWRKKWPSNAGFEKMVKEFPRLAQNKEVSEKMARWVELYIR